MDARVAEDTLLHSDGETAQAIFNALLMPVLLIDGDCRVHAANGAAEHFFEQSEVQLRAQSLEALLGDDNPLIDIAKRAARDGTGIVEYEIEVGGPKLARQPCEVQVVPAPDMPGHVVMTLEPRSVALKIDRQLLHRGAARSLGGLAAVLAHEVKNPLSGIRGAAQLLEEDADEDGKSLARLIRDEADRICALVDQMEAFSDPRPVVQAPLNIHEILGHVRKIAANGFARDVTFEESYDPSLPAVLANRDQLIQVFLNLVKNAAESIDGKGKIRMHTRYRHGIKIGIPGRASGRLKLPIEIAIADNGPGVPEDIRDHLFDPFVSGRAGGTGLGLAIVAKFVRDMSGVVECDNTKRGAVFRILLPEAREVA